MVTLHHFIHDLIRATFRLNVLMQLWTHVRRGTHYLALNTAQVQASTRDLVEGDEVMVYMNEDGNWYVRLEEEFKDGRFNRTDGA